MTHSPDSATPERALAVEARLSPMMERAKALAKRNGGKLWRHPGGFWGDEALAGPTFGASTIAGMVKRGIAEYSEWKDGRNGRFPIQISLIA